MTATSFFPAKPLGCYGDGGAVLTDDDEIAARLRSLRVHGAGDHKYDIVRVGINGRLDTLQAAVLIEKLTVFADELSARQSVALRYNDALEEVAITPLVRDEATSSWAQYTLRLSRRDEVAAALASEGIPTGVYYRRPLHRQEAYRGELTAPGGLPVSEQLGADVLSLPMHPYLSEADQQRIVDALRATAR
jgi:dTDP-4-amino-4,6-dideoxygalactose transaminase